MIHSIDNDGFSRIHVMAVRTHTPNCSRCAFSAAAPMDFRGKKTDLESKRKQFRYGYYYIIIANRIYLSYSHLIFFDTATLVLYKRSPLPNRFPWIKSECQVLTQI